MESLYMPTRFSLGIIAALAFGVAPLAHAGAREEARLLTATEVLEEIQGMPDQRVPDLLLSRAYGIAVIPDVAKVAFGVGGRRGKGVLVVRDKLTTGWSNPVFVAITGGSVGWQIGAQASDIVLVFTTKSGVEGISDGKLTLGADASIAAGPIGRQGSAATDINFTAEVYSYSRTRGLFAGAAIDGSALTIDRKANGNFYGKRGVTPSDIFSGTAPTPPASAQRFLERLAATTRGAVRESPAPQAEVPAASGATPTNAAPKPANEAQTFPMEDPHPGQEPPKN
jgi:lipid-binding SYLF domain-containing protein